MIAVAPWRRNQAASGTHAFRVGSITTVTDATGWGICSHSWFRSAAVVLNLRPDQANRPASSARLAWWAARHATSIPSVICTSSSSSATIGY